MAQVTSINPYTGSPIKTYNLHNQEEVNDCIEKAAKAFRSWKQTTFEQRSTYLEKVANELENNAYQYAATMSQEMGKPITQSKAEIEKCAWVCRYYASNAKSQLAARRIKTDAFKSYVCYEPLGVVLAVMPWNYPFWQVFRFAAPALMAGNIPILKHASNVVGSALLIQKVFERAGLPEHCFTTLKSSSQMVPFIIEHNEVKAVTLTGSGPAGAQVASLAGKHIKKSVLELGGNNALIVCKDCNLEATVSKVVQARFQNTGQSCIAGKRLLVAAEIAASFVALLKQEVEALVSGDPLNETTYIGTMAREDLAEELEEMLLSSVNSGARIVTGGKRNKAYFEPTLVTEVTPDMKLFKEETFGPVLAITTFDRVEEAVQLSNQSKFGLGVSIFTENRSFAESLVPQFNEGAVFINEIVKSDPRLPFGGIKQSGYGRELSTQGIKEFTNCKTVYIN